MQMKKNWRLGAIAAAAAVATIFTGSSAAFADPSGAPTYRALSGVGSDTTQDLNNGLSSAMLSEQTRVAGSYNATNPTTGAIHDLINTRTGGPSFERPNGSSEGVNALKAAKTGTAWRGVTLSDADLQFARSSSAASQWVPGGTYSYIPLALDAVSFAVHSSNTTIPHDLTQAQLTAIYSADNGANVTINGTSYKVGTEGTAGVQITPFIPQLGSGTRSFWQSQLAPTGFGSAVDDAYTGGGVQEHDGSVLAALPTTAIVPFSIAQWVAQNNKATIESQYAGVSITDRRHGAILGTIGGIAPTTGTAPVALNTMFPIARPVFTVVKNAELATNAQLAAAFSGASAQAYTTNRPGPSTALVITDFGFGSLAGGVSIDGVTYTAGDTASFRAN
ncbi:ABC-type phosphate transport system, substrate-binding protein [Cryobacterium luteum]|nr:ABC-type phosphate transport system, substrate-binding protein [Cryobacterium luteum]